MKIHYLKVLRAFSITLIMCVAAPVNAAEKTLRLGVVPQFDARKTRMVWQPILTSLEEQTGIHIELVGSPGIPEFEKQLMAGEFDLAYMNPYHLLKANDAQGYIPLVRDVGRTLFGIVVTRKDSPVQDIYDLDGKTVAFPAPNALGAALIPRTEFGESYGISIQPVYVKNHSSVYLNVVTGQAAAGGGVQKTLQSQPEYVRNALRVIYKTPEVAPHPLAAHPRIGEETCSEISKAFLQLGNSQADNALLARIPMKQAGQASMDDYEPLRKMGLDKYYVQ
jgi:phosphonate transport system substrate-binding protein